MFLVLRNDSNVPCVSFFGTSGSKMFQASENLLAQAEEAKDLKEKTEERVWVPGFIIRCLQIAFRLVSVCSPGPSNRAGWLSRLSGDHGFMLQ